VDNNNDCTDDQNPCLRISECILKSGENNYIPINLLGNDVSDTVIDITKSVLIRKNATIGNPVKITPVPSLDKKSFINVLDKGNLKISGLTMEVSGNPLNYALFKVTKGGVLNIFAFVFSLMGTGKVTVPIILQEGGSTTLGYSVSTNIPGSMPLESTSFADVKGGSFQTNGISVNVVISQLTGAVAATDGVAKPLFLNAFSSNVTLKYTSFGSCSYAKPTKEIDTLNGGLISVVGDSNDYKAILILESVTFSTIGPGISTGAGVVNGGALYGAFLRSVSISEGSFTSCSASSGSGGALYIEDVKTTLTSNGGMNMWIVMKKVRNIFCLFCFFYSLLLMRSFKLFSSFGLFLFFPFHFIFFL
jgi:hypothetical protein